MRGKGGLIKHACVNIISITLDSEVEIVSDRMQELVSDSMHLFSDLPGFLAPGGGSIPPNVLVTNLRPDIFIVNETSHQAVIFELTCPWDSNIVRSHDFKEEKYAPLVADLSERFRTCLFSVEVSVRGQVTAANKKRLKAFVYRVCDEPKAVFKSLVSTISKVALMSSFSIFAARAEPSWSDPPLLNHA